MRRRTPAQGIPTWDDDVTPPPQDLPIVPAEDVPPPIAAQLSMLREGVNDARHRAYEVRLAAARLDKVDAKLGAIATTLTRHQTILDENLVPQLDRWRAVTDGIARDLPGVLDKLDGVVETLDRFDQRLRDIEVSMRVSVERLTASHDAIAARVAAVEAKTTDTALRLIEIEKREHGREAAQAALAKTERRKTTAWAGLLSAVAGAATWLAQHLFK